MGFRFRRSISILPGLRLNISKRGLSTSIGGRGHTVNISRRGVRTTVGIPGTAVSYSTLAPAHHEHHAEPTVEHAPEALTPDAPALSVRKPGRATGMLILALGVLALAWFLAGTP